MAVAEAPVPQAGQATVVGTLHALLREALAAEDIRESVSDGELKIDIGYEAIDSGDNDEDGYPTKAAYPYVRIDPVILPSNEGGRFGSFIAGVIVTGVVFAVLRVLGVVVFVGF